MLRPAARCGPLILLLLAGCVTSSPDNVQRATQGPTAEEIHRTRFVQGYGRLPTFDESAAWRAELDQKVTEYFTRNPEISTSPRASQFRFQRRVAVGMSREEVTLLVGPPESTTTDEALMKTGARQFWPQVQAHAREMWVYPAGWRLYFDGDRLADLTVVGKPPIE